MKTNIDSILRVCITTFSAFGEIIKSANIDTAAQSDTYGNNDNITLVVWN